MATALAVLYVLWRCFTLSRRVPLFADSFAALGASLPAATRLAITVCKAPVLWTAAAVVVALLIWKEFAIRRFDVRLGVSIVVFMLTAMAFSFVNEALVLPMLQLMQQIGGSEVSP